MKIWRELLSYVKLIVIVVAITLVINNVVLINAKIPSPSMEKTLMVKDRLFGFRLPTIFSGMKESSNGVGEPSI